ncbi:hypothetical protein GCM10027440_45800 [Nocardiopsis coralliicola]
MLRPQLYPAPAASSGEDPPWLRLLRRPAHPFARMPLAAVPRRVPRKPLRRGPHGRHPGRARLPAAAPLASRRARFPLLPGCAAGQRLHPSRPRPAPVAGSSLPGDAGVRR